IYADENCTDARAKSSFITDGRVTIFEAIQSMENNVTDELSKAQILLFGKDIQNEILALQIKTSINLIVFLAVLLFIAYHLAKLALKPLYMEINTLNRFIKDSTHEINTPLSIIMMSIETADKSSLNNRNLKRMNNIELAAKSLSNIYEDLVHLTFNSDKNAKKELINLRELLLQRLEYFAPFFAKRNLKIKTNLNDASINANRYEMTKILDNLLSNAAKYTNLGGNVTVNLNENSFSVTNSGDGISKEQQNKIYDRYTRFNNDQGGFGIGLNLVKQSCRNNDISIKCESELGKDTTFLLTWN
ncbi:MAG: HAMP domain-containing histidine kinase, partial [Campylobacter sp.]|nr:HAMP domain-containing histidine kinase [Campylobacter sp.]